MILIIVAVRDLAAESFAAPLTVPAVGLAMRSFTDQVNHADANNAAYNHPADFELWQLGTYDDSSGELYSDIKRLARALDVKTTIQ